SGADKFSLIGGGMLGLAAGVVLGAVMYFGLTRVPTKHIFVVRGWLILLLAAGMASQGAEFLAKADILPSIGQEIWNSSAILSEKGLAGQVLHILVGYDEKPMGIQLIFYFSTLTIIGVLMLWQNNSGTQLKKVTVQ
ncbi:MAG: FTR1 family protein, partial [Gammaproteobacteria bacterium]|nr:FTR1 family protein [Gammaproteobacteria bacterium]